MAPKKNQRKRDQMFAAWCEQPSIRNVCRKCHVAKKTAERYRITDEWDARYQQIQDKIKAEQDKEVEKYLAKRMNENIALLRSGKVLIANALKGQTIEPKLTDLVHIIRLEEELVGNPNFQASPIIEFHYHEETVPARETTAQPGATASRTSSKVSGTGSGQKMGKDPDRSGETPRKSSSDK